MGTIIGSSLFALVMLWVAMDRIIPLFQSVGKAAARVRGDLYGSRNSDGYAEVARWKIHPLSDHMVKEIASAEGLRYVRDSTRYGSRYMQFFDHPQSRKKASGRA
ncbi:hypothetical protein DFQ14_1078 [Halopolyspora algeriensis]|uniref:Uncharacterized protein n=1 Tax=Halopolyspora algeriensis TaxID=1500506 RepID=A0A368VN28_9ACTN|nr:hypothetical protein [Halopolyspora algeriensis]RCW43121.1 hypothetical protein DFQ14_1078 [Halopolyspora algeriensis]TQM56179.1 hypothetical protein FHU43_0972 [Halopolyspora algeriensis]